MLTIANYITATLSLFLGCFVLFSNSKKEITKVFFFLSLALFIWSIGFSMELISTTKKQAYLWNKILYMGAIFVPVLFFQLTTILLKIQNYFKKHLFFFYILAFLLTILNYTPYFTKDLGPKGYYQFITIPGWAYNIYIINYFFVLIFSLLILVRAIIKEKNPDNKKQNIFVFIASIIAFIGASSTYFLIYFKIQPIGVYFIFSYSLMISYAILKHNLLDIKRFIQDTAVILVIFITYATLSVFLHVIFRNDLYWLMLSFLSALAFVAILALDFFRNKRMDRIMQHRLGMYKEQIENYSVLDSLRNTVYGQVHDLTPNYSMF